jgi:hypothetical protein
MDNIQQLMERVKKIIYLPIMNHNNLWKELDVVIWSKAYLVLPQN